MAKTIWILEDDVPTLDVYKRAFEQAGYSFLPVVLGKEALEQIEKMDNGSMKAPDVFLIDLMLPDINGLEVLKKIRSSEKTKNIPAYILTNYTDSEMERLGFDLGTEKHILKAAVSPSQLLKIIKEKIG